MVLTDWIIDTTISVVRDKKGKMAARGAKAVFVGNIKGGVGKSTLTVYLT